MIPKIGQKIYVRSSFYISHGSDDFVGGMATISEVENGISGGEPTIFVTVKERPDTSYNWPILEQEQEKLKEQYGSQVAHPDPDIDTPWIEPGDHVNGQVYNGPPII